MHERHESVGQWLTAACVVAALTAASLASAQTASRDEAKETAPLDAAQAVQEGSVPQWLEYYRRERGFAEPAAAQVPPSTTAHPPAKPAGKADAQR
jgi:hypothetical protein